MGGWGLGGSLADRGAGGLATAHFPAGGQPDAPRGSLGTGPWAHVAVAAAAVTATGGQAPADLAPWVPWEAPQRPTCSPRGRGVRAGLPRGRPPGPRRHLVAWGYEARPALPVWGPPHLPG